MKNCIPLLLHLLIFGQKLSASTNTSKTYCRQVKVEPSWTIKQILDFRYYTNMANKDPDRIPCIEGSIQNALRQRKSYLQKRQIHESEDANNVGDDNNTAKAQFYPVFEAALNVTLYSYAYQKLAAEDTIVQDFVRNISVELNSHTTETQLQWCMKNHVPSLQKYIDYIHSKLQTVTSIQQLYNNVSEWTDIPAGVGPVTRLKKNLIQSTFTKVTHTVAENGTKLIINGLYLRMSEVLRIWDRFDEAIEIMRPRRDIQKFFNLTDLPFIPMKTIRQGSEKRKPIEIVEIHSKHIFYVDASLKWSGSLLVIIAPVWKIVNESKIIVGAPDPDQYPVGDKAPNGVGPGADGNRGKAGHPGKPGANFFALAIEVDHPENLTIHMEGGKSGDGQAASDGVKGKDGRILNYRQIRMGMSENEVDSYCAEHGYEQETVGTDDSAFYHARVLAYCEKGGKGGNGGTGGPPGKPGKPGLGLFLILKNTTGNVKITKKDGEKGSKGADGKGGAGGGTAPRKTVQLKSNLWTGFKFQVYSLEVHGKTGKEECNKTKADSGKDGGNKNESTPEESADPKWTSDVALSINRFKGFLLTNIHMDCQNKTIISNLFQIMENVEIRDKFYKMEDYINEAEVFEGHFYKLHQQRDIDFLQLYTTFNRILEASLNGTNVYNQLTEDQKRLHTSLHTMMLVKIWGIEHGDEESLVIDLEKYLELTRDEIDRYKQSTNELNILREYGKEKERIAESIRQTKHFLAQIFIQFDDITEKFQGYFDEIKKHLEEEASKLEEEDAKQQKKAAEVTSGFNTVGGIMVNTMRISLVVATQNLELIPKFGSAISKIAETRVGGVLDRMGEGFSNPDFDGEPDKPENCEQHLRITTTNLHSLNNNGDGNEIIPKAKDLLTIIPRSTIADDPYFKIANTYAPLDPTMNAVTGAITEVSNRQKVSDKMSQVGAMSNDLAIKYLAISEKLTTTHFPQFANSVQSFKILFEKALDKMDQIEIDKVITGFRNTIYNLQNMMSTLSEGMGSQNDIMQAFKPLKGILTKLERIQQSMEKSQTSAVLNEHMTEVSLTHPDGFAFDDKEQLTKLVKLRQIIQSNIILTKYRIALNSFKLFIFPFGEWYLDLFKPNPFLVANLENIMADNMEMVYQLRQIVSEKTTRIVKSDQYVYKDAIFDSSNDNTTEPFYTWDRNSSGEIIANLLSGELATLMADVSYSPLRNAIKFNEIGIRFKSNDSTIQKAIDIEIQNFAVIMVHQGTNYYRCGLDFYRMESKPQYIQYFFRKDENGLPIHRNQVFDKLRRGDPVLSPYANWLVQIINVCKTKNAIKDILSKYKGLLDVELVGRGQYVSFGPQHAAFCTNLNRYYTPAESTYINKVPVIDYEPEQKRGNITTKK